MAARGYSSAEDVARLVRESLDRGRRIEIDGLGVFEPDEAHGLRFRASDRPKVFLAYVEEDVVAAERLYDDFSAAGFAPWLDRRKLLPGQNWPRAIEFAIETTDFFVACFSTRSVAKKGGFQAEIRYALDCARSVPLDEVYLVPVRLDACRVPARVAREWQYVDLFPNWKRGFRRIETIMRRQLRRRAA